jgi:DNA-binding cell septation regulator SpoVG
LTLATDYPTGPELAVASVTLGRSLTLRNLRLVRDSHGIPRVRYPARREGDRWLQLVEVIDRELGDEIRGTILLGFERYRDGMPAESEEGITW